MLLSGDEIGRTQGGNNNGYCQDNEISWIDWNLDPRREGLLEYTRSLISLFHEHPVLRRRHFFQGRQIHGSEVKDLAWFRPDGHEVTIDDWSNTETRCFGLMLSGNAVAEADSRGNRIRDDTLLMLFNSHYEPVPFVLPEVKRKQQWQLLLDTREGMVRRSPRLRRSAAYTLESRSFALFRLCDGVEESARAVPSQRRRVSF